MELSTQWVTDNIICSMLNKVTIALFQLLACLIGLVISRLGDRK